MKNEVKTYSIPFGDTKLEVEIGKLATLASSAVKATYGETVVLASIVVQPEPTDGAEFFPLTVDYEERWYASGKISGSRYIKREARPSDEAVLNGRLIDRTIRPLFPDNYRNDVQVIITVLSTDLNHDPAIAATIATSLGLMLSPAPFEGPVGITKAGLIGEEVLINPTENEIAEKSDISLTVCSTEKAVVMIEAGAKETKEEATLKAIEKAHQENQKLIDFQNKIYNEMKVDKQIFEDPMAELYKKTTKFLSAKLAKAFIENDQEKRKLYLDKYKQELALELEGYHKQSDIEEAFDKYIGCEIRKQILEKGIRPDGRKLDELRPLSAEIGLLPRTHGSGLFARGETQVLSVVTLGAPSKEQSIETMEEETTKRYIHHYNFPPYSVGEVRQMRGPSRRDIGHGALAEKAILPVLPTTDEFPYTIRVVSEVLTSNGSTSMASTCGSSLALMDAGVPIKKPVAGISVGLVLESTKKYAVFTDIQGIEDHSGDMDFKVTGTKDGITAIQLDVKTKELNIEIIEKALEQAKKSRLEILELIDKTISKPKTELSKYAPRVEMIKIKQDKIREVIGPGGKIINKIIADCGVDIDIDDDGTVFITGEKPAGVKKAIETVSNLVKEVEVGEIYQGTVVKIMDFGAFVEVLPNQEGLVHISQMADHRVENVSDIVKVGDKIPVKVVGIDELGRINLSLKEAKK